MNFFVHCIFQKNTANESVSHFHSEQTWATLDATTKAKLFQLKESKEHPKLVELMKELDEITTQSGKIEKLKNWLSQTEGTARDNTRKSQVTSDWDEFLNIVEAREFPAYACRHRAVMFSFLATLSKIPARFVCSKTHAWVECLNDSKLVKIDLGSAPANIEYIDPFDLSGRAKNKARLISKVRAK